MNLNCNDANYEPSASLLIQLNKQLNIADLMKSAIDAYYEQKRISNATQKALIKELYIPLKEAVQEGFGKEIKVEYNTPNYEFLKQLKTNVAVFAAFKNHARLKDIGQLLIDNEGKHKSKSDFINDALAVNEKYKVRHLSSEYDAAVKQARSAALYKKALETAHLFPNIKYMPSVSAELRVQHMSYYNLVLPIKHPLWDKILPIKAWGCKCWWRVTDETVTEIPENFKTISPDAGLGLHAGKTGQVFDLKDSAYIQSIEPALQPQLIKQAQAVIREEEAIEASYFIIHENKNGGHILAHPLSTSDAEFSSNLNKAQKLLREFDIEQIVILPNVQPNQTAIRKVIFKDINSHKTPDYIIDGELFDLKEDGTDQANHRTIKRKMSAARGQNAGLVLYIENPDYILEDELFRQINANYSIKTGEYDNFKMYIYYKGDWLQFFHNSEWLAFYSSYTKSKNPQ